MTDWAILILAMVVLPEPGRSQITGRLLAHQFHPGYPSMFANLRRLEAAYAAENGEGGALLLPGQTGDSHGGYLTNGLEDASS